jgi:hypothetical protein
LLKTRIMAPKKTIEDTYQKKSQLEHVLHRPGMYIGDIETVSTERWVVEIVRMEMVSLFVRLLITVLVCIRFLMKYLLMQLIILNVIPL